MHWSRYRRRVAAWPLAAVLAGAYLIVAPSSADLAAQTYRAGLFARRGFALWDGQWFAGHHVPGYSILFPPLGALVGPRVAGALAAVVAAALFEALVRRRWGERARWGALWFAATSATLLLTGRMTFALGVAVGLAALVALQRERRVLALVLGALATLASPVAGLFVALVGLALALGARRPVGLGLAAAALAPALALAVAFPEGGHEPFAVSAFWPVLALAAAGLVLLPARERTLRVGLGLYAVATVAAFAIATPMGGNAARLGALFAGPVLTAALAGRPGRMAAWRTATWRTHMAPGRPVAQHVLPARGRPRAVRLAPVALAAGAAALVWWPWSSAIHDVVSASTDPSVHAAYYRPLLGFLARHERRPARVEVLPTRDHWEAAEVAPRFAIARGWERQLDIRDNGLFYAGELTPSAYLTWLRANGVRWVAVPDAPLDYAAGGEARLVDRGLPYLRPAWHGEHWRVLEVRDPAPLASGAGRLVALRSDAFTLRVAHPGRTTVRVRFTPYWALTAGAGCVARAPGGWTAIDAPTGGTVHVGVSFALGRVESSGPRCHAGAPAPR